MPFLRRLIAFRRVVPVAIGVLSDGIRHRAAAGERNAIRRTWRVRGEKHFPVMRSRIRRRLLHKELRMTRVSDRSRWRRDGVLGVVRYNERNIEPTETGI